MHHFWKPNLLDLSDIFNELIVFSFKLLLDGLYLLHLLLVCLVVLHATCLRGLLQHHLLFLQFLLLGLDIHQLVNRFSYSLLLTVIECVSWSKSFKLWLFNRGLVFGVFTLYDLSCLGWDGVFLFSGFSSLWRSLSTNLRVIHLFLTWLL